MYLFEKSELADQYFPEGVFGEHEKKHYLMANFIAFRLKALEEQSFYKLSPSIHTQYYRFLWLRSFHNPICISIDIESEGKAFLTVKMGDEPDPLKPGKLIMNQTHTLQANSSKKFLHFLNKADYWNMPHIIPTNMLDGASWIMEGRNENKYQIVDRWCPKNGPFRKAALYLIREAKLRLKKDETY